MHTATKVVGKSRSFGEINKNADDPVMGGKGHQTTLVGMATKAYMWRDHNAQPVRMNKSTMSRP